MGRIEQCNVRGNGLKSASFCETPLPASFYLALSAVGWGREELVAFYIQYYQHVMWALQLKGEIGFVSVNGALSKLLCHGACLAQARQPGLERPFMVSAGLAEITPQQPVARAAVCSVGDDVLLNAPQ